MWSCDPALSSTVVNSQYVAGPVFAQALQAMLAAQCALVGDHLWPADATDAVIQDPNYDFVVVGAGSAGSVVANRLSEIPDWKVLLIEAGGNPTLTTEIPQTFYSCMNTAHDWAYKTEPQDGACRAYKTKGCAWPRGKVLGGSSSINAMFYVRGNKVDYDEWAAAGNTGWSYEEVLQYFKKSENLVGDLDEENKEFHSKNGYYDVEIDENTHFFEDLIISAAVELGHKNSSDINGASQMGVIKAFTSTQNKARFSTARAFLSPIKDRKNLHVIKNAHATKIAFKPGTRDVSGLIVEKDGKEITININKELIVSGGAINSPQLLMLSGIGPRKHLEDLGIKVIADLPVGENLEDHVFVPLFYTLPDLDNYTSLTRITEAYVQYMLQKQGPLADTSPHRVIAFFNTTDPEASSPDTQAHHIVFPPGVYNLLDILKQHDLTDEVQNMFYEKNKDKFTMIVYNVLLKPKSVGKILLKNTNPYDHPLIYANYFDDPEDMAAMLRGLKQYAMKFGQTKALQNIGFKMDWMDIKACNGLEKGSDEHLECYSRELTFSLYHPTTTVKMGPVGDKTSVVDPELRVKGVGALRVIDASIMPSVVRGNTNAPSVMIGEKGADMVKNYWLKQQHTEL